MKIEVMDLIEDLGFNIVSTGDLYGVEDARVRAERGGLTIQTAVTGAGLKVEITSGPEIATFYFMKGELPDLRFREYTQEMFELARHFGAVAGFRI